MSNNKIFLNLLPISFSNEENEQYLLDYQNGNQNAKNELIEHNLRLVVNIIDKKFYNVDVIDRNDLFSIGVIGLDKAIETFDMSKGYKFSTYAGRVIINEILMSLRKTKYIKNDISLESVVHEDKNGNGLTLENMIASDDNLEESYINEELKEGVRKSLEVLTEKERDIVEFYYGFKGNLYNCRQIGEILGISRSYVSRIISKAQQKISNYLISQGLIEDKSKMIEINEDSITIEKSLKEQSLDNNLSKEKSEIESRIKKQDEIIKLETDKKASIVKGKKLMDIFPSYSEVEINCALEKLDQIEREILLLRYPINDEKPKTHKYFSEKYDIKIGSVNYRLNTIVKKVNKLLEGQMIEKEKTIFQYFSTYSEEQVMNAISSLNDESKRIIELRYGLNGNAITSIRDIASFYNIKVSSMSRRVCDIRKSIQARLEKMCASKKKVENNQVKMIEDKEVILQTNNPRNDNFEQYRNQIRIFINLLNDPIEQVVLLLRLGYIKGQNYTESQIGKFLNISEEEVKDIINKSLSNLASISSITINWLESENKTFKLHKKNLQL